MMYIKLDDDMNLIITQNNPIYRGDNLNQNIIFLISKNAGGIEISTATIFLCFIRADGTPDIIILDKLDEPYDEMYYQYTLPVTCKLTKYPGEVCTWICIYSGTPSNPTIAKTGECTLWVQESKDMDCYLSDSQLTAIYAIKQSMSTDLNTVHEMLNKKADDIKYDEEKDILQLTSENTPIGTGVDVSKITGGGDDVIHFNSISSPNSAEGTGDDVIHF